MTRRIFRLLAVTLLSLGLAIPLTSPASAHPHAPDRPDRINLPNGFRPEGIAIAHGRTAYISSLADGDIYRADLRTGEGSVISEGPGTSSVGLKLDHRGRLFIAGGPTGSGRVLNLRTGDVTSYQFTAEASFVNDVVLAHKKAWFTDSQLPQLYVLPLGRHGRLPDPSKVVTLQLTGDWDRTLGASVPGSTPGPSSSDHPASFRHSPLPSLGGIPPPASSPAPPSLLRPPSPPPPWVTRIDKPRHWS